MIRNLILILLLLFTQPIMSKTVELNHNNLIPLNGEYNKKMLQYFYTRLQHLKALSNNHIFVVIDSPGGEANVGLAIADIINQTENISVICVRCYSMGAFMPQFIKTTRYAYTDATYMIHKPSAYFQGSFTSDDLRKMLKEMTTFELVFFDKISKRMGRSIIDLLKLMQSRDLFLNGKEAIKMNLADELIDLKCSKELEQDRYQDILVNRTGKIYKVIMSKCPAIRLPVAISVF